MKRKLLALGLGLSLAAVSAAAAQSQALPALEIDGLSVQAVHYVEEGTTYVSLRLAAQALLPEAEVAWQEDRAIVRGDGMELAAVPGHEWITANGRALYVPGGVRLEQGRTLLPIRVIADAFGAEVVWDGGANRISVTSSGVIPAASYEEDALYWLSRIISAESQGEPLAGQIAVGNVVLNRVESVDFPNTIYGVIFDQRWGGQFEPVENGTVYHDPTPISVTAAKLCLEGADVVGDCLYFLDPVQADNLWTTENRPYVTTIGVHDFYL